LGYGLKRILLVAVALYVLALLPRVIEVVAADPQGDELMWNQRSSVLLDALQDGRLANATSHLGHPGIPAAGAMAIGKVVNGALPPQFRIDDLGAARIGNALLSSMTVPITFLGLYLALSNSAVRLPISVITAVLIAFYPQHIAISRLAHIDSSLALFVTLAVCLFARAVATANMRLKIAAGIAWGLALCSKPTALTLIPAFVLYKLLRRAFSPAPTRSESVIARSDLVAVVMGFATLALLFTRFWHHNGPFLTQLNAVSPLADAVFEAGIWLRVYWPFALATIISCLLIRRACLAKRLSGREFVADSFATLAGLVAALAIFPQVFENFVRYIVRLPNLAEFVRVESGFEWGEIPGGYLGVYLSQLPSWSLVLLVLGVVGIFRNRRSVKADSELRDLFLLLGTVVVVWTVGLSFASKEFVRYVVPVLPALYVFAAYSAVFVSREVTRISRGVDSRYSFSTHAVQIFAVVPLLVTIISVHPNYLNFYNDLFGGLRAAVQRNLPMFYQGNGEALRFLHTQAQQAGAPLRVAVVGDIEAVRVANQRLRSVATEAVTLGIESFVQGADYALVTHPLVPLFRKVYGFDPDGMEELFRYSVQEQPMVSVLKPRWLTFDEKMKFPVFALLRETGGTTEEDPQLGYGRPPLLYALPERHQKGLLFFDGTLPVAPGSYRIAFSAALPHRYAAVTREYPYEVLRAEFGPECVVTVTTAELVSDELREFSESCVVDKRARLEVRGWWSGVAPIVVEGISVERLKQ
jgi:hypothetical protein